MNQLTLAQALQQAIAHHQAGELAQAERLYRAVLQKHPHHTDANYNLGLLAIAVHKPVEALPFFKTALDANPKQARFWLSYIETLIQTKQLKNARAVLIQGQKRGLSGQKTDELVQRLLEQPSETQIAQLISLFNQGHYHDVEQQARILSQRFPEQGVTWKILGAALPALDRLEEALAAQIKSVALLPNDASAFYNLGNTFKKLARLQEAVNAYQRAIRIDPRYAEAYNNLALSLQELGHLNDAEKNYRLALAINATNAQFFYNLGITLQALNRLHEAENTYRLAIAADPHHAQAHNNLGNTLKDLGQLAEAETCYRTAICINPDYVDAQSNLLYAYNYSNNYCAEFRLTEAKHYYEIIAKKVQRVYDFWHCETPAKRLRVGLMSGDFRNHPVAYFLENLLTQWDSHRLELIAYTNFQQTDTITARIKPYFAKWQPIFALNDEAVARLIHQDGVHILIDLSGHTAHNRLPVFAWKPAPIQVTWLGYFATTGVTEMDYILVDEIGVPENQHWQFVEKVRYLPDTRLCFSAPTVDIAVSSLPALTKGYITFGCFQNLGKVTDAVLAVWAKILARLPTARLRFQGKQLLDEQFTEQFYLRLAKQGIESARVSTHGAGTRENYLAAHSEVDIILDTFPYTGGTTTCEALWMGVPTLTLAGETLLARQGASLLSAAGLSDWIAFDLDSYLEKAVTFASDLNALAKLRAHLREQVLASPLFDSQRFARHFEQMLSDLWHDYQVR